MRGNLSRLHSGDLTLDRIQDAIKQSELLPYSIADGRFLETTNEGVATTTLSLTTTAQTFNHKLGRSIQGYFIAFQSAGETIYGNITSDPTNSLQLQATGNVSAKIWVF